MEILLEAGESKRGILMEPQSPDEREFIQWLCSIFNKGGDVTLVTKDGKEITHAFQPLRPMLKIHSNE